MKSGAAPNDTLQATVIVNEFYCVYWASSARSMRIALISFPSRHGSCARFESTTCGVRRPTNAGGGATQTSLASIDAAAPKSADTESLHDALNQFERFDQRRQRCSPYATSAHSVFRKCRLPSSFPCRFIVTRVLARFRLSASSRCPSGYSLRWKSIVSRNARSASANRPCRKYNDARFDNACVVAEFKGSSADDRSRRRAF